MTSLAQESRIARAADQYASYRFRLTRPVVNGKRVALISVTSPAGKGYSVYGNRCNCVDFQRKCQDESGRAIACCKHITMSQRFLAEQAEALEGTPVISPARFARDWPEE